jgi:predicted RNA polymerase sigma factor
MAAGPAAGLAIADTLTEALDAYHLLHGVRAEFLGKLGRTDEARAALERAASLTKNAREREILLARITRMG